MEDKFEPRDFLGFFMSRTKRYLAALANQRLQEAKLDVTIEQCIMIEAISRHEYATQNDLADRFFKDKASITRMLGILERNNIVVRSINPLDRRQKVLHLTHKGKMIRKAFPSILYEVNAHALEGISAADVQTCFNVLEKAFLNLEKKVN